jgi:hypothetical protein
MQQALENPNRLKEKKDFVKSLNLLTVKHTSLMNFSISNHLNSADEFLGINNSIFYDFEISYVVQEKSEDLALQIKSFTALPNLDIAPNDWVINKSLILLDILSEQNILPDKISCSQEGSIIWEFLMNETYYMIEFFNDCEVIYLRDDNNKIVSRTYTFEALQDQIIDLLNE